MAKKDIESYLPLTETTYYTLLALIEPMHGYALMQTVEEISEGTVNLGAGTLYNAFGTLKKEGLIFQVAEDGRRKYYQLSEKGKQVLALQIERLEIMARNGQQAKESLV